LELKRESNPEFEEPEPGNLHRRLLESKMEMTDRRVAAGYYGNCSVSYKDLVEQGKRILQKKQAKMTLEVYEQKRKADPTLDSQLF